MAVVTTALAAASAWATVPTVTTLVARLAISTAVSALTAAVQKQRAKQSRPGIKTDYTTDGGTRPMGFVLGWYGTDGHMACPPMSHGRFDDWHNAYLTYVIDLGNVPGAQLDRVIIDDEEVEFAPAEQSMVRGGDVPAGKPDWWYYQQGMDPANPSAGLARITPGRPATTEEFRGKAWLRYYDGTQTAADPYLTGVYGPGSKWAGTSGRPWTADMVGLGTCYAVLTFRYSTKTWSGLPRCRFVLRGTPLYDPRKDSTAGGSGSHRWNNPATWETTTNGIVLAYNILRGIPIPGGPLWGYGVDAADLPFADWSAAMTAAAQVLDGAPRWQAAWEVSVDEEPADALDEVLKASCARVAETGGVWKVRVGPPAAPVYFLTDDDLIQDEDATNTPFPGLEATFNGVHASYPEPKALWRPKDAPPRYNAAWEARDRGRRLVAELNLPACPWEGQVQRVMLAYIQDEQRWRRHSFALPPDAEALEPLDVFAWTSAENGYDAKFFEIVEITEDPLTLVISVVAREVDPADYDWRPDFRLPSTVPSVTVPRPAPIVPQFFTAEGIAWQDNAGRGRQAAARLRWGGWALDGITGVMWELRRLGETQTARGTMADPEAGETIIAPGLAPLTDYQARIQFMTDAGVAVAWTGWVTFRTPEVRIAPDDIDTTAPPRPGPVSLSSTPGVLIATWSDPAGAGVVYSELEVTEASGNPVSFQGSGTRYEWKPVLSGIAYTVRRRAVDRVGNRSAWSEPATHTVARDTVPPATPTGLKATGSFGAITLKWNRNTESDFSHYEIAVGAATNPTTVADQTSATTAIITDLAESTKRFIRIRAVDTSDNKSGWTATVDATTTTTPDATITTEKLAGLIDSTSFKDGTQPIRIHTGAALPTTKLSDTISWNAKLYRWNGSKYVDLVNVDDLAGKIPSTKFADGIEPVTIHTGASLPAAKSTSALMWNGKLYRWSGTAYVATVPAADIAGQVTAAQIAGLEASKISGQLTDAQVAEVSAAKLTGQIKGPQIENGAISDAKIAGMAASKVTGQLTDSQIASVGAAKVAGQLTDAQIAGISAGKMQGQITSTQITDNAITTAKIAANAVTATEINAGAVSADKIAANAVTAGKISAGAVETAKLAAGAVAADKIAANAVTAAKIEAGAVEAGKIAAGAVQADKIAAGAVVADKIAANAVEADKIKAGAVEAVKIAAGAVETSKLAAGAVVADKIAANAVTAAKIEAGAVVASKIAAAAVEAGKIAAGAITTDKLDANAVTAGKIAADAITAGKVAAGAINTRELAAGAVKASNILVTTGDNLILDPEYHDLPSDTQPSAYWWVDSFGTTPVAVFGTASGQPTSNYGQTRVMTIRSVTSTATPGWTLLFRSSEFAVQEGEDFLSTLGLWNNRAAKVWVRVRFALASGESLVNLHSGDLAPGSRELSVTAKVPAGALSAEVQFFVDRSVGTTVSDFNIGRWYVRRRVDARLVVEGSITTNKLAIGDFTNLILNSDLASAEGWSFTQDATHVTGGSLPTGATSPGNVMLPVGAIPYAHYDTFIPVSPGEQLYAAARFRASGAAPIRFTPRVAAYWFDRNRVALTTGGSTVASGPAQTAAGTYVEFGNSVTAPEGAAYVRFAFGRTGNAAGEANPGYVESPYVRRKATGKLIVDGSIVGDHIEGNAIKAGHLDAGVVTSQKLAIGFGGNLLVNSDWGVVENSAAVPKKIRHWYLGQSGAVGTATQLVRRESTQTFSGSTYPTLMMHQESAATAGYADLRCYPPVDNTGIAGRGWPVKPGEWIEVSAQLSVHRCTAELRIEWRDEAGVTLAYAGTATLTNSQGSSTNPDLWERIWIKGQAPANAAYAVFHLRKLGTTSGTDSFVFIHKPMMALSGKDRSEPTPYAPSTFTFLDGDQIITNSVKARSLDVTDLVASLATIDTAYIREANITGEISAAKLKAGTALAANITVNGTTINQVRLDATLGAREPAARVNEGAVTIDPGKITISGGTTLADWRKGGDVTKIDGGALSANTVTANKLEIGSRNITLTGIQFEHNNPGANQVSWTSGWLRYVNDAGAVTSANVQGGNATWTSGVLFIYWTKGDDGVTLRTTTSLGTAMGANNVVLATYEGGTKLDADYGRTIIDGSQVKTGTITATQLVKTAALITETAQIKDLTVTALKIANNELYVPRFYARADVFLPLGSSRSNPSVLFDRTIPDFNGGGYIIAFNGYVDSSDNFDRFGQFQLLIDGVAQAEVGAGARTNSGGILAMIPVSLISSASGNGSTRIIVRGWSRYHNNPDAGPDSSIWARNLTLTISGARK